MNFIECRLTGLVGLGMSVRGASGRSAVVSPVRGTPSPNPNPQPNPNSVHMTTATAVAGSNSGVGNGGGRNQQSTRITAAGGQGLGLGQGLGGGGGGGGGGGVLREITAVTPTHLSELKDHTEGQHSPSPHPSSTSNAQLTDTRVRGEHAREGHLLTSSANTERGEMQPVPGEQRGVVPVVAPPVEVVAPIAGEVGVGVGAGLSESLQSSTIVERLVGSVPVVAASNSHKSVT